MEFGFEPTGRGTGVVVLAGRLDLMSAPETSSQLHRLVADGWSRLVLDLSEVPFIDSSGLGAIIGAMKSARSAGGDFRLARCGDQLRYILRVSTLDRVLVPFDSVEQALADQEEPQVTTP